MQPGSESVLNVQRAMNGGGVPVDHSRGFVDELGDVVDATPKLVAGMLLGAVLALLLLRVIGFRFSFGVAAGGS